MFLQSATEKQTLKSMYLFFDQGLQQFMNLFEHFSNNTFIYSILREAYRINLTTKKKQIQLTICKDSF